MCHLAGQRCRPAGHRGCGVVAASACLPHAHKAATTTMAAATAAAAAAATAAARPLAAARCRERLRP